MRCVNEKIINNVLELEITKCELSKHKSAIAALKRARDNLLKNMVEIAEEKENVISAQSVQIVSEEQPKEEGPAKRTSSVEPILKDSIIGREVFRCGWCKEKVGPNDKYCHSCGKRVL